MSIGLGMNFRLGNRIHQARGGFNVRAKVGTFDSATVTGNQSVTGVGFQPKVVLPFGGYNNMVGTNTPALLGFGAATSTSNEASIAVGSSTGLTTSSTRRRHTTGIYTEVSGSSTVLSEANLESFDSDGFTVNWTTADATARIINNISLGGSTLEANLVQCQMNGTNAAQSFAHGLSGEPTAILLFSAINATAPPNTGTDLFMSLGAWAGGNQFGASVYSNNGVTTTSTRRLLSTSHAIARTTTSIQRSLAISSVDATNVNVTYPNTIGTSQDYFWMLCLRGCKAQVGTFDLNDSLDPLTIACPGIVPKLFLPVMIYASVSPIGTIFASLFFTIGASDGNTTVSCGITDRSNLTTTSTRRYQSSSTLVERSDDGALRSESSVSFSGQSVIVDPSTINIVADYGQGGYLIIGE